MSTAHDAFPLALHWDADALAAAVQRRPPPLHTVAFAPSANDAEAHRPHRDGGFAPAPTLPSRFRIG